MNKIAQKLDKNIIDFYKNAVRIAIKDPRFIPKALGYVQLQKNAAKKRGLFRNEDTFVPPFMIVSVTNSCNLRCKGCYAHAQNRISNNEMETNQLIDLFNQARDLGISTVIVAGGEPFMRKDLIDIFKKFPEIMFVVFTNGLMFNAELVKSIKKTKNIIPIISIEGNNKNTDNRRGAGVYNALIGVTKLLKKNDVIFGFSITVSKTNYDEVLDVQFIKNIIKQGPKVIFFIDYVPFEEGTENIELNNDLRIHMLKKIDNFKKQFPVLFTAFPGDESQYGGCLSSGKGFFHVSPAGDIEPCPFAPYSVDNINQTSLKEVLNSDFFTAIRENTSLLEEDQGGCALFRKRDEVMKIKDGLKT